MLPVRLHSRLGTLRSQAVRTHGSGISGHLIGAPAANPGAAALLTTGGPSLLNLAALTGAAAHTCSLTPGAFLGHERTRRRVYGNYWERAGSPSGLVGSGLLQAPCPSAETSIPCAVRSTAGNPDPRATAADITTLIIGRFLGRRVTTMSHIPGGWRSSSRWKCSSIVSTRSGHPLPPPPLHEFIKPTENSRRYSSPWRCPRDVGQRRIARQPGRYDRRSFPATLPWWSEPRCEVHFRAIA